jgi:hypothetical protein
MAIVVPADPSAPLRQGDILTDVTIAVAEATAVEDVDIDGPGSAMVISRHCNALRDPRIVVAKVEPRSLSNDGLAELKTLDEWRRYFSGLRDGKESPDNFYLGELVDGSNRRYFAKLDSLHTLRIPPVKPGDARAAFIAKHRIFHLHDAFVRDLHSRIFNAFAELGFDDYRWFIDSDLALVVKQGQAEIAKLRADVLTAEASLARDEAETKDEKQLAGLRNNLKNLKETLAKREEALLPYSAEQERRARG